MTLQKPKGFWSYARHDGALSDGRMEELHRLVSYELGSRLGLGEPVDIFLDKSSIATGEEWEKMIEARLDEADFLVAIITPVFLNRPWCCKEIKRFREREVKLGRSNLIFPIEYMEVRDWRGRWRNRLHDPDVLTLLDQRQVKDFTQHRHDDPKLPVVRRFVDVLCREIAERLFPDDESDDPKPNLERIASAEPTTPAGPFLVTRPLDVAFPDPEMVRIGPGTFLRGTTDAELSREKVPSLFRKQEQPRQEVTISRSFELSKYTVTRGEFARFVTQSGYHMPKGAYTYIQGKGWERSENHDWANPGFPQTDRHPVTCVSQDDAMAYVKWLSEQSGKDYRLPTEAEWEYACRAGTKTARFWGDDRDGAKRYANVADQSLAREWKTAVDPERFFGFDDGFPFTAPVGSFDPNPYGLYDMLGNVWEWTQDRWHENYDSAPSNETPWTTPGSDGGLRVLRGGSWDDIPRDVRSGCRNRLHAGNRGTNAGFWLARTL